MFTTYNSTFLLETKETHDGYTVSSNMVSSFESGRKWDLTRKKDELHVVFVFIEPTKIPCHM